MDINKIPTDEILLDTSLDGAVTTTVRQSLIADMRRMAQESKEAVDWAIMKKGSEVEITKPVIEQDFDCLRDLLVDMCSATLPGHPPSQEDWTQIRERVRAAAVEHSAYNREEKKATKKPRPLLGRSADLLITDDLVFDPEGLDPAKQYTYNELIS